MPAKIRLSRRGRKNRPIYDIIIADARAPRDGKFIEKLGLYNPNTNPASITLNHERALYWVKEAGAQPTDTMKRILSYEGIMLKKHLQVGVDKGAITQEVADQRFAEWQKAKLAKIEGKIDALKKANEAEAAERLAKESEVNQARLKAIQEREAVQLAAETPEAEAEEAAEAEGDAPAEESTEEQA